MTATRASLFATLDDLGIAHETRDHPPIFTVEEGRTIKETMPGGHSKNLFLKDKKRAVTLVTALSKTAIDLVALGRELGSKGRLSFGKPDLMLDVLGITPGSVTPFALINAAAKDCETGPISTVVVDTAFFDYDRVWFHPLENTASTAICPTDLIVFIESCGYTPQRVALGALHR